MKNWPAGERPRERFLQQGASSLSDVELLAIVIGSGTRSRSAVDLARDILCEAGTLRNLGRKSPEELMRISGIGSAKAVGLLAAIEVGRRVGAAPDDDIPVLTSPEHVACRMIPLVRDKEQEVFLVLVLDARNCLKKIVEISRGTLNAGLVHPREVFKVAIDNRAAAIIVVHNHPSGNPEPSHEDLEVTRQLAETGRMLGIPLHDHVIVAGNRYTSLAERGHL